MSLRYQVDAFRGVGGLRLVSRRWQPPGATRALAIIHGLGEHSERYDAVARWFAARGYAVHAFDQRGHGDSEGVRNHTPSFGTLLDDIESFLERVRRSEPGRPLVLLGHSMGGLEVAGLLAWRGTALDAAVLSGPGLRVGSDPGGVVLALARLLGRLWPRLRIASGVDPRGLCRDPAVVAAYLADPRIDTRITLRLATELLWAARRVRRTVAAIRVPTLIVHGEADPICRADASRAFHLGLRPAGCELRTYPGLLHEILNEPEREQVMADIHAWVEKRVPAASPA